jgi:hypothetical protein
MNIVNPLKPTPTKALLEQQFLEIRCKILDLAAQLDRLHRGGDLEAIKGDPKWTRIQKGIAILANDQPAKAQSVQELFSLQYDPEWKKPSPRF